MLTKKFDMIGNHPSCPSMVAFTLVIVLTSVPGEGAHFNNFSIKIKICWYITFAIIPFLYIRLPQILAHVL